MSIVTLCESDHESLSDHGSLKIVQGFLDDHESLSDHGSLKIVQGFLDRSLRDTLILACRGHNPLKHAELKQLTAVTAMASCHSDGKL